MSDWFYPFFDGRSLDVFWLYIEEKSTAPVSYKSTTDKRPEENSQLRFYKVAKPSQLCSQKVDSERVLINFSGCLAGKE
ncbi:hypothetical protein T265_04676 [Opisthorchis viverrini]|uniref:Uncharacterized protein n=1 Tax=Opisthorchis viverrini TaxID=6198 RepID=A0A074ZMC4_OPIVI|nr:hypothetical protein T265_04676 [Opisthorchis viverrini]KER28543.1 hypothetical protein T265_04676 [Opisthorchis viverrini]